MSNIEVLHLYSQCRIDNYTNLLDFPLRAIVMMISLLQYDNDCENYEGKHLWQKNKISADR